MQDKSPDAVRRSRSIGCSASKHYGERHGALLARPGAVRRHRSATTATITAIIARFAITSSTASTTTSPSTASRSSNWPATCCPNPTQRAAIASGYNRLLMTTRKAARRPRSTCANMPPIACATSAAVWLAATLGCCECHDHKFDPYSTQQISTASPHSLPMSRRKRSAARTRPVCRPQQEAAQLASIDARIAPLQKTLTGAHARIGGVPSKWWEAKLDDAARKKLPKPVAAALALEHGKRTPAHKQAIQQHFPQPAPELAAVRAELNGLQARRSRDPCRASRRLWLPRREAAAIVRILPRGNWLDDSGEIVEPACRPRSHLYRRSASRQPGSTWRTG